MVRIICQYLEFLGWLLNKIFLPNRQEFLLCCLFLLEYALRTDTITARNSMVYKFESGKKLPQKLTAYTDRGSGWPIAGRNCYEKRTWWCMDPGMPDFDYPGIEVQKGLCSSNSFISKYEVIYGVMLLCRPYKRCEEGNLCSIKAPF